MPNIKRTTSSEDGGQGPAVHESRRIDTTAPLQGGGDLSQDRVLSIDASIFERTLYAGSNILLGPNPITGSGIISLDPNIAVSSMVAGQGGTALILGTGRGQAFYGRGDTPGLFGAGYNFFLVGSGQFRGHIKFTPLDDTDRIIVGVPIFDHAGRRYLVSGEVTPSGAAGATTSPGAPDTSIQFNSGGTFAGSSSFTFADSVVTSYQQTIVNRLTVGSGIFSIGGLELGPSTNPQFHLLDSIGQQKINMTFQGLNVASDALLGFTNSTNGGDIDAAFARQGKEAISTIDTIGGSRRSQFIAGGIQSSGATASLIVYGPIFVQGPIYQVSGSMGRNRYLTSGELSPSTTTPGTPFLSVQYNNAGTFGGSDLFTFDPSVSRITISAGASLNFVSNASRLGIVIDGLAFTLGSGIPITWSPTPYADPLNPTDVRIGRQDGSVFAVRAASLLLSGTGLQASGNARFYGNVLFPYNSGFQVDAATGVRWGLGGSGVVTGQFTVQRQFTKDTAIFSFIPTEWVGGNVTLGSQGVPADLQASGISRYYGPLLVGQDFAGIFQQELRALPSSLTGHFWRLTGSGAITGSVSIAPSQTADNLQLTLPAYQGAPTTAGRYLPSGEIYTLASAVVSQLPGRAAAPGRSIQFNVGNAFSGDSRLTFTENATLNVSGSLRVLEGASVSGNVRAYGDVLVGMDFAGIFEHELRQNPSSITGDFWRHTGSGSLQGTVNFSPSQTGDALQISMPAYAGTKAGGQRFVPSGEVWSIASGIAGILARPAGSSPQLQYNTGGKFDADSGLIYDAGSRIFVASGLTQTRGLVVSSNPFIMGSLTLSEIRLYDIGGEAKFRSTNVGVTLASDGAFKFSTTTDATGGSDLQLLRAGSELLEVSSLGSSIVRLGNLQVSGQTGLRAFSPLRIGTATALAYGETSGGANSFHLVSGFGTGGIAHEFLPFPSVSGGRTWKMTGSGHVYGAATWFGYAEKDALYLAAPLRVGPMAYGNEQGLIVEDTDLLVSGSARLRVIDEYGTTFMQTNPGIQALGFMSSGYPEVVMPHAMIFGASGIVQWGNEYSLPKAAADVWIGRESAGTLQVYGSGILGDYSRQWGGFKAGNITASATLVIGAGAHQFYSVPFAGMSALIAGAVVINDGGLFHKTQFVGSNRYLPSGEVAAGTGSAPGGNPGSLQYNNAGSFGGTEFAGAAYWTGINLLISGFPQLQFVDHKGTTYFRNDKFQRCYIGASGALFWSAGENILDTSAGLPDVGIGRGAPGTIYVVTSGVGDVTDTDVSRLPLGILKAGTLLAGSQHQLLGVPVAGTSAIIAGAAVIGNGGIWANTSSDGAARYLTSGEIAGGTGATPGTPLLSLQYNNSGAFAGADFLGLGSIAWHVGNGDLMVSGLANIKFSDAANNIYMRTANSPRSLVLGSGTTLRWTNENALSGTPDIQLERAGPSALRVQGLVGNGSVVMGDCLISGGCLIYGEPLPASGIEIRGVIHQLRDDPVFAGNALDAFAGLRIRATNQITISGTSNGPSMGIALLDGNVTYYNATGAGAMLRLIRNGATYRPGNLTTGCPAPQIVDESGVYLVSGFSTSVRAFSFTPNFQPARNGAGYTFEHVCFYMALTASGANGLSGAGIFGSHNISARYGTVFTDLQGGAPTRLQIAHSVNSLVKGQLGNWSFASAGAGVQGYHAGPFNFGGGTGEPTGSATMGNAAVHIRQAVAVSGMPSMRLETAYGTAAATAKAFVLIGRADTVAASGVRLLDINTIAMHTAQVEVAVAGMRGGGAGAGYHLMTTWMNVSGNLQQIGTTTYDHVAEQTAVWCPMFSVSGINPDRSILMLTISGNNFERVAWTARADVLTCSGTT